MFDWTLSEYISLLLQVWPPGGATWIGCKLATSHQCQKSWAIHCVFKIWTSNTNLNAFHPTWERFGKKWVIADVLYQINSILIKTWLPHCQAKFWSGDEKKFVGSKQMIGQRVKQMVSVWLNFVRIYLTLVTDLTKFSHQVSTSHQCQKSCVFEYKF